MGLQICRPIWYIETMGIRWPGSTEAAKRLQERLSKEVVIRRLQKNIHTIAAFDASYCAYRIIAAVMVFTFPGLDLIEKAYAVRKVSFPYVPGLLSFREGPALLSAYKKLKKEPDLLLFDGQGIAHPRGLGIASHMGVILNKPSIGCAKSRLIGDFKEPQPSRGAYSFMYNNGKKIGIVLRTRSNVSPVFVSPGHLVSMEDALKIILQCSVYRIPEPIRQVDRWCHDLKGRFCGDAKGRR